MKTVLGVGINDADYKTQDKQTIDGKRVLVWICPYYSRWRDMLKRCYSPNKSKAYTNCKVCDEWLTFSNFKAWMEQQDWQGKELDKDLLLGGNNLYSPETCMFVPKDLNIFTIAQKRELGIFPMGVSIYKGRKVNPYYAYISSKTRKTVYVGSYESPEKAHTAYLQAKLKLCIEYKEKYINDSKISCALSRIMYKIESHLASGEVLTSF